MTLLKILMKMNPNCPVRGAGFPSPRPLDSARFTSILAGDLQEATANCTKAPHSFCWLLATPTPWQCHWIPLWKLPGSWDKGCQDRSIWPGTVLILSGIFCGAGGWMICISLIPLQPSPPPVRILDPAVSPLQGLGSAGGWCWGGSGAPVAWGGGEMHTPDPQAALSRDDSYTSHTVWVRQWKS